MILHTFFISNTFISKAMLESAKKSRKYYYFKQMVLFFKNLYKFLYWVASEIFPSEYL